MAGTDEPSGSQAHALFIARLHTSDSTQSALFCTAFLWYVPASSRWRAAINASLYCEAHAKVPSSTVGTRPFSTTLVSFLVRFLPLGAGPTSDPDSGSGWGSGRLQRHSLPTPPTRTFNFFAAS